MTPRTRSRLLNVLKVVVSLGALALLLSSVDLEEVMRELGQMRWLPFLSALGLFLTGSLVRAYRWGVLVWALDVHVSWWRLVSLYFVGAFFGQFLPTGVGGDAVKMYELSRDDHKAAAAISSVLVDRFLGLFVLFAMALVALIAGAGMIEPRLQALIAAVFFTSLVAVAVVLQRTWMERWGRRLHLDRLAGRVKIVRELYESIHLYGPGPLLRATVASIVWNLILILGYYLLGRAVGITLSLWYYFLLVPIISALLMLPSVGGLGVREGGTIVLFVQAGVAEVQAGALAGAYLLTNWTTALVGAILYVVQGLRGARGI
ncbi:MAG TPA: lysylphosphatidylglycerol synthase transmembrane domain-containing protein [Anaerolineae bacterium]|nr:lysylphosphatidylglycerol synthase transmembrane domain-containing protein [Anaerolineae bacterium]